MKRKFLLGVLGAEAIACVLLRIAQASLAGVFSAAMAFPFEQIGLGLRSLSLSGGLGNAAAVIIYAAISLSPAVALLILRKRRRLFPEDALLGLLSIALFVILYLMVNPGIMSIPTGGQAIGKMILGGAAYSVLCGYFVLRALRLFFQSDAQKLARYMSVMLGLIAALFVYAAFGARFGVLLDAIASLRAGNVGNEHLLWASYFILDLGYLADMIPYILNIFIIFSSLRLLDELRADRYSEDAVAATGRVSRLCAVSLAVTVFLSIAFNLLQVVFAKSLRVINVTVSIPVLSIAFVLAALLLTRFVAENKRLKDDNDMFI